MNKLNNNVALGKENIKGLPNEGSPYINISLAILP